MGGVPVQVVMEKMMSRDWDDGDGDCWHVFVMVLLNWMTEAAVKDETRLGGELVTSHVKASVKRGMSAVWELKRRGSTQ